MVEPRCQATRNQAAASFSSFTLSYFLLNKIISNVQKSPMFMPAAAAA